MAVLSRLSVCAPVIALLLLTGCRGADEPTPAPTTSAGQSPAADACGGDTGHRCFDLGAESNLYCHVVQVRELTRQGRLQMDDLPGWAVEQERAGVPVVYDFRAVEDGGRPAAAYLSDLVGAAREAGAEFDRAEVGACARDLTQEQVRDSEGGWPRS